MTCLICSNDSIDLPSEGDFRRVRCETCGVYRVTRTLDQMLNGRLFDQVRAKIALEQKRTMDQEPVFNSADGDLIVYIGHQ